MSVDNLGIQVGILFFYRSQKFVPHPTPVRVNDVTGERQPISIYTDQRRITFRVVIANHFSERGNRGRPMGPESFLEELETRPARSFEKRKPRSNLRVG